MKLSFNAIYEGKLRSLYYVYYVQKNYFYIRYVYGIELNAKKTKTMCISKTIHERFVIRTEDKDLEQVHEYQSLGSTITEDGKVDLEIKRKQHSGNAKSS